MRYRYRLGKDVKTVVLNEDFNPAGGAWTGFGAGGWTNPAPPGTASHAGAWGYINYPNLFTLGEEYEIVFTFANNAPTQFVRFYIGDFSIASYEIAADGGTHTITGRAMSGLDLHIGSDDTIDLDSVVVSRLDWNAAITDEPIDWQESNYTLEFSDELYFSYVTFIDKLTFQGDGYQFFKDKYDALVAAGGFCEIIPVKMERWVNDAWEDHFVGVTIVSENVLDLKKELAEVSFDDETSLRVLRVNGKKAVNIEYQDRGVYNLAANWTYPTRTVYFRDAANCLGAWTNARTAYECFRVLRQVVHEITNLRVTLESDLLTTGDFQFFSLIRGKALGSVLVPAQLPINKSVIDLLTELDIIFNIGSYQFFDGNGIPTMKVEMMSSLLGAVQGFTLDNNIAKFGYDLSFFLKNVKIGFSNEIHDGGSPTVDNWSYNDYVAADDCSQEEAEFESEWFVSEYEIDLAVRVGPDNIIWSDYVWVQVEFDAPQFNAKGIGSNCYNTDIQSNDNMTRHTYTLQSSFTDNEHTRTATKPNAAMPILWDGFKDLITVAQLDLILADPYSLIPFASNHITGTLDGWIRSFEYSNKADSQGTSDCNFQLVTETS